MDLMPLNEQICKKFLLNACMLEDREHKLKDPKCILLGN